MPKSKSKKWSVIAVVVLVLVGAGYYLSQNGWKLPGLNGGYNDYQAVFLSNGQVYFGRAASLNGNYIKLTDVYYLQVSQALQPAGKTTTPEQSVSLAKLGISEIHKPKDEMLINRSQVLFVETMGSDSQVTQAIKSYKESLSAAK